LELQDFKVHLDRLDCLERPVSQGLPVVRERRALQVDLVLWDLWVLAEVPAH